LTASATAPSRTDLSYEIVYNQKFVPIRSLEASVKTSHDGSETSYIIRIGQQKYGAAEFFQLDEASYKIWELIDGQRTVKEITQEAVKSGAVSSADYVTSSLLFFAESRALKSHDDPVVWKRIRMASSFMAQIALIRDSSRLIAAAHRVLRPVLRTSFYWASLVLVLVATVLYAPRFQATLNDARNFQILGSTVVGYLFYNFLILAPVIVIHELSHGLALYHYSGRSGEVGTGLFYFGPMFYVDTTGYWSLNRSQRMMIMWAGNLSTLLIGSILILVQFAYAFPSSTALFLNISAFWCFYGTLWNLAPPFETDGYYILSDLVNTPNLRPQALSYLKSIVLRVLGRHAEPIEGLTAKKKRIFVGYAIFSVAVLGYIVFQSLRFTSYMATDAANWAGRIGQNILSGNSSAIIDVVGLVSIGYFAMIMTGYGVLVGNQVRKSLVKGLQFETVHDRDLAVFLYLPRQLHAKYAGKLDHAIRKAARQLTPNFSLGRRGALFLLTLRLGSASVPLSEIRPRLGVIEKRFYKAYAKTLGLKQGKAVEHLMSVEGDRRPFYKLLFEMTGSFPGRERREAKEYLGEFVRREKDSVRYLLESSFSTAWTLEVPPSEDYEMLESLLPGTLVEDLSVTNLAGETEEFKKHIIYGLDTVSELARAIAESRDSVLENPGKAQLVALLEPIRGRIVFVGRTDRIEDQLSELGLLFMVHVWSGYTDHLLTSANLGLYAIAESLPPVPEDLGSLSLGELNRIDRYLSELLRLEPHVMETLVRSGEAVKPSKLWLRNLKALLEPDRKSQIELFNSILRLNEENLESVSVRLKDGKAMAKPVFVWVRNMVVRVGEERERRSGRPLDGRKSLTRAYRVVGPISVILALLGVLGLGSGIGLTLLFFSGLIQLGFFLAYFSGRRSAIRIPRNPSGLFLRFVTPVYALAQTMTSLVVGGSVMNPLDLLEEKKGEQGPPREKRQEPVLSSR